jgi:hypothetical protein
MAIVAAVIIITKPARPFSLSVKQSPTEISGVVAASTANLEDAQVDFQLGEEPKAHKSDQAKVARHRA